MKLTFRIASSPTTLFIVMFLGCMAAALPALAQEGLLDTSPPKGITVEEITQRFAAKEKEFKVARDQYTYRQDVKVMVMDGETVTGEYHEVFDVLFDDKGRRLENVVFAPQSDLEKGGLSMDQGDFEDIRRRIPKLQAIGLDRIVCQFDDPMRDAGPFMKNVIRPLRERRVIEFAE